MDRTQGINNTMHFGQPRPTISAKVSQDVKTPFQFKIAAQTQKSSAPQGSPASGGIFQRPSLSLSENLKLPENTLKRDPGTALRGSLFKFSPNHKPPATGVPVYSDMANLEKRKDIITINPFKEETRDSRRNFDVAFHSYMTAQATTPDCDQQASATKEDPDLTVVASTVTDASDSEDLLLTVTTRYRQVQRELAKQRDYITELETQLSVKNDEVAALSASLAGHNAAKEVHREALDKLTNDHTELKVAFEDLKHFSASSAALLTEARETMHSLFQLKECAKFDLKGLESILDDSGKLILAQETRTVIDELRLELTKSEQVSDLLRDKLQTMASELVEERSRVSELQDLAAGDIRAVELVSAQLHQSANHVAVITNYMREQKDESIRAATEVYGMEQQLAHVHARMEIAESQVASMKQQINERDQTLDDQKTQIGFLRNTVEFQERNIKELEAKIQKTNEELLHALNHSHEVEGRLNAVKDHEKNILQQNYELRSKQDAINETLTSTQHQLVEAHARQVSLTHELSMAKTEKLEDLGVLKQEVDLFRGKHIESLVSLKALQERFDDQSVTLTVTRESVGELQERLNLTDKRTAEIVAECRRDVVHLQEQKELLEARLVEALGEIETKTEVLTALRMELSHKEGASETLLNEEKQRANEAQCQIVDMKSRIDSLLAELGQKNCSIRDLQRRLEEAESPCINHEQEVSALASRIIELEEIEKEMLIRASTITQRYTKNDLNDDEKVLISTLMQKARALHDREMVDKNNEIKRRDNVIKQHEARVSQLEDNLASRIHEPKNPYSPEVKLSETVINDSPLTDIDVKPGPYLQDNNGRSSPIRCIRPSDTLIHLPKLAPSNRPMRHASFSKLAKENSEDEEQLTNKRVLFAENGGEPVRPARRARYSKAVEVDRTFDKASECATKKTVKRR